MSDAFIQVPPNSTGLKLDVSELVVGANTVERERINIADPTNAARIATVTAANELNVIASAQPGVDIGDVTINNAAGGSAVNIQDGGNSLTVDNATISVVGGGVEATAQRVTIASDSTGVLSIDDNGGSLTVDGSVTVSGTIDTELTTADFDTGAGTDTRAVVGLVYGHSGGGILVSDTNPLPISDNGGNLSIDDGGNSITVDGSVTVTQATGTNLHVVVDSGTVTTITNVVHVDDNAGSLTIDGSVALTDTIADNAGFVDGTSKVLPAGFTFDESAGTALTENDAAAARIDSKRAQVFVLEDETTRGQRATVTAGKALKVDGSAVTQPVSDAGGLLSVDDGAGSLTVDGTVTANQGTAAAGSGAWPITVTNTSDTVVKPGDAVNNAIRVNIVAGAGSGGTAQADNSAFTEGSTTFTPIGGEYNDSPVSAVSGDAAAARITVKRALHVNLRDASGNEVTVGGGTQYAEDTVSTNADQLTMAGVVRQDNLSSLVNVAGDRTELSVDQRGALYVVLENDTALSGLLARLIDEQRATRVALLAGFEALQYAVLAANNAPPATPFLRLPPEDFDPDTNAPSELTN